MLSLRCFRSAVLMLSVLGTVLVAGLDAQGDESPKPKAPAKDVTHTKFLVPEAPVKSLLPASPASVVAASGEAKVEELETTLASEPTIVDESPALDVDLDCGPVTRHIFGHVDYLLWVPRRQGQDFAIQDPAINTAVQGPIESAVWDTRSGLRIGVGWQLCADWDVVGTYTYLHSAGGNALTAGTGGSLLPTLVRPGLISDVTTASATSNVDYDVWDVDFGRRIRLNDSFDVRLAAGAKFALIDQKLNALYNGIDASNAQVSSPVDFDGAGLRVGGEGNWTIWRRFGIYGKAFGSMLAGEYKTSFVATNGTTTQASITQHYRAIVPVAELGLGLMWQGDHIQAKIGYDMTNWFDFVDSPDMVDDVTPGKLARRSSDFSLDGLVISLGFSY